ncbi:hypothetical protein DICTH_1956 [Dictyoglomus thermophilum H-6-12]|uniref:Uncharacterized protein n=1 Tax=Dictyoglomus thermophilum (strain ATCC 35947 / DSM 3960 / H-6-12) TaxID=309799 RepID=B5YCA3_DICT6|nr:hypothetical protein DICTH_1956 [Dictyoglomus thermophilum H-6-12]
MKIFIKIKKGGKPLTGPPPPSAYLEDVSTTISTGGLEIQV